MRKKSSGLPNLVSVGYGTMKSRKGLHPSGYREIIIYNQNQLDSLNRDIEAVRISAQVSEKKRLSIIEKAEKLDLKILNPTHIDEETSTTELPLEETEK
jgi:large subunit ribosomal protein L32e